VSTFKKHSALLARQLSQYIRQDHPHFLEFVEAYFEWLEETGNALEFSKNLPSYQDVDFTLDSFITYFKREFLAKIPESLYVDPSDSTRAVDKRKLIKSIKQFYRARGTEKSFRFLFRILFDAKIDFYYPRVDMLKASDGKWFQDVTIRTRQLSGNPFLFANQKIRGTTSNSSAFVEHVQKINVGPLEVYEIFLNRSSIIGLFLPNELIVSDTVPGTTARTYHLLTGIQILNPGEGYSIGDEILITQAGPGYGGRARVENVDELGKVLKVKIIDYGAGYSSGVPTGQILFPAQPMQAFGVGIIGGQTLYPGYFLNDDGKISNAKFIQDSFFYQQFSYVIKVEQSLESYKSLVQELLHPAGLLLFGEFFTQNLLDARPQLPDNQTDSFIIVQRHVGFEPQGFHGPIKIIPPNSILFDPEVRFVNLNLSGEFTTSPPVDSFGPNGEQTEIFHEESYIIQGYEQNLWHWDGVTKSSYQDSHPEQGYVIQGKARVSDSVRSVQIVVDQLSNGEVSSFKLGPSWRSIEQFKFTYEPSSLTPNDDANLVGANAGYWAQYGNLPIRVFANVQIKQVTQDFRQKTNIMPEPVLGTYF